MAQAKAQRKETIPKKAQIILLLVGLPVLLWAMVYMVKAMGWVGAPKVVARTAKATKSQPAGGGQSGGASQATPGPVKTPDAAEETRLPDTPLAEILLAVRDPFSSPDLTQPPPTTPGPGPGRGPRTQGPTGTKPPVIQPVRPGATGGQFPSPTGGGTKPPQTPVPANQVQTTPAPAPTAQSAPPLSPLASLAQGSPALQQPAFRGRRRTEQGVRLVGTVSGPQGSVAVMSDSAATGRTSRYVEPGDRVGALEREVETVEAGEVTLSGPYRSTQTLTLGDSTTGSRQGGSRRGGELP